MSISKALLYTILITFFWAVIQLVLFIPIKYSFGLPDDRTHIYGIAKIVSTVGAFLLIYYFFWKPKLNFRAVLKVKNYNPRMFPYLLIIVIGLFLFNRPFWDFLKIVKYYKGISISDDNAIDYSNKAALIYNIISTMLIAPVIEELFFRKFLLAKLLNRYNLKLALFVSALFFSIIHIETPSNLIPAFAGGVVFGFMYLKTKRIDICIILHFLFNSIVLITNNISFSYDNWLLGYNFNIGYWLLSGIGLFVIVLSIKKITTINY